MIFPTMTHRVETCEAVTRTVVNTARGHLDTREGQGRHNEEQSWRDGVCSQVCSLGQVKHQLSPLKVLFSFLKQLQSIPSIQASLLPRDKTAEVAAYEATLDILLEQERHIEELNRLEAEDKKRIAE